MLISKFWFLIQAREVCVDLVAVIEEGIYAEVEEGVDAKVGEGLRVELSVGEG